MLLNVHPLLTPKLLYGLACLGHGDVVAIVDRNFPAYRAGEVVELPGIRAADAVGAVLTVLPIDTFGEWGIAHMLCDDGSESSATEEVRSVWSKAGEVSERGVSRVHFYPLAQRASITVRTGETLPYACYLVTKGVC